MPKTPYGGNASIRWHRNAGLNAPGVSLFKTHNLFLQPQEDMGANADRLDVRWKGNGRIHRRTFSSSAAQVRHGISTSGSA